MRVNMSPRGRASLNRLAKVVLLLLFLLGGATWGLRAVFDYRNKADFNAEAWSKAENCSGALCEQECIRGGMVSDLQRRHLIPGTPRVNVVALLGPGRPTARGDKKGIDYNLGMCSGFRMDFDSLIVAFDESDRLTNSWTVQH